VKVALEGVPEGVPVRVKAKVVVRRWALLPPQLLPLLACLRVCED
jgi:hypothetical protein